ncbi:hypothetical protein M8C21_007442 [Ambrosia artemisiifolia]|uniref:Methyltransferase-related protein n=1 Tax=Ambrosia artemisiifolia TaxID=4212 RepID=A0AAD5GS97_AMBAR|nr:hypothetical protein M8C21_007442 [Ambrosia artemisiifolia]
MCPLRIILIFLSATLAGFFVLRNLNSHSDAVDAVDDSTSFSKSSSPSVEKSSHKVYAAFVNGFWTCVDMASGRYLWRNLVSVSKKSE